MEHQPVKAPDPLAKKLDLRCAHGLLRSMFINRAMHLHVAKDLVYDSHYLRDLDGCKRQTDELSEFDRDFSLCEAHLDKFERWQLGKDRMSAKATIYGVGMVELGVGATAAEAACYALLRAHGIEVLT